MTAAMASLLMLADGRLPVGAHANGGGVEWAARHDELGDPAVLEAWIRTRLHTVGTVEAAFAVSALARSASAQPLHVLDVELSARIVGERARLVSRQLGRQFTRAAKRIWTHPDSTEAADPDGPYAPVALGMTGCVLELDPRQIAAVALHHVTATAATASVRLLGLDPLNVAAVQARLSDDVESIASLADEWAGSDPADLPARNSPLAELLAEDHGTWTSRLFVA